MSIFLGYSSALEVWRAADSASRYAPSKALPQFSHARASSDALSLLKDTCPEVAVPVHCVVGKPGQRIHSSNFVSRVSGNLPAGSFCRIAKDVHVASPEALVLQMASILSLVELTLLVFELCGSYSVDKAEQAGFRKRPALTTVAKIARYLEKAEGLRGVKQARRAIAMACDNSASPMESKLVMLLCLPSSMGGYEAPLPVLNQRIDIDQRKLTSSGRSYFVADLLWRGKRLIVEYDSEEYHSNELRIADDVSRRNALDAMGYRVISLRKKHVFDAREFEQEANRILRHLGIYYRSKRNMVQTYRYILRQELLYGASPEKIDRLKLQMRRSRRTQEVVPC